MAKNVQQCSEEIFLKSQKVICCKFFDELSKLLLIKSGIMRLKQM